MNSLNLNVYGELSVNVKTTVFFVYSTFNNKLTSNVQLTFATSLNCFSLNKNEKLNVNYR
jgi:hypothetical protein